MNLMSVISDAFKMSQLHPLANEKLALPELPKGLAPTDGTPHILNVYTFLLDNSITGVHFVF